MALLQQTRLIQWRAEEHREGLHAGYLIPGCSYCFPPGLRGDYRPALTMQCHNCAHVEDSPADLLQCGVCRSVDVRVFPTEAAE